MLSLVFHLLAAQGIERHFRSEKRIFSHAIAMQWWVGSKSILCLILFVECWYRDRRKTFCILVVMCWEIETLPCEGLSWHGYTILTSHHNPIQSVSREIAFLLKARYYVLPPTHHPVAHVHALNSNRIVPDYRPLLRRYEIIIYNIIQGEHDAVLFTLHTKTLVHS